MLLMYQDESILHYESPQNPIVIDKANGQIRVECDYVESISIYDANGRMLTRSIAKDTINISQLRHGVYVVYVLYDEGSRSVKFIK